MAEENCNHEQFEALTSVGRITESEGGPVTRYVFECKVRCKQCGMFFEFVGLPTGASPNIPMASADFTELRAPIRPFTGELSTNLHYDFGKGDKEKNPN